MVIVITERTNRHIPTILQQQQQKQQQYNTIDQKHYNTTIL